MSDQLAPMVRCVADMEALSVGVQREVAELSSARLLGRGAAVLGDFEAMLARVSEVKLQPAVTSALGYEPMRLGSLGSNGRVFDDATEQVRLKAVADEKARLKDECKL